MRRLKCQLPLSVVHVSVAQTNPGGMSQVVAAYAGLPIEGVRQKVINSSSGPGDLLSGLRALRCALYILRMRLLPRTKQLVLVNVHLSKGGSFIREGSLVAFARLLRVPVVSTIHGSSFEAFAAAHPRLVAWVCKKSQSVFVLTLGSRAAVERVLAANGEPRVIQIYNPALVPSAPAELRERTVIFCGEVGPRKGVDVLLAAWEALGRRTDGWRLLLLGPVVMKIESQAKNVVIRGAVSHSDAMTELARSAVAVLPSRAEAFPMFLLEAMARACAVVATDVGEVRNMIGQGGTIVAPGSVEELTEALGAYMLSPQYRQRDGASALERVMAQFSTERLAETLEMEWRRVAV